MDKYHIDEALPHKAPMILIDGIEAYDDHACDARVVITKNSLFYCAEQKGVPSYIGCEYMAQAIAGFAGSQALDKSQPVQIGFLLGSRKYKTTRPYFLLGETLKISLNELYSEDSGLRVFDCKIIDQNNITIAIANVNVFQPPNPEQFIKENQ